ncbi:MAG TPA: 2-dehydropantoate 2-reductase [Solirubrobacteraceae bacterium]|nr:2-dehydropantoate 2-reductase [Solirubrobacteraceae bacterium]
MKIGIMGAGAVGSAYGHLLGRGGHEVVLVDAWAEHVEQIRRGGLVIDGAGAASTGRIEASTNPAALASAEAVLVLVKAFSNEAAGAALAGVLGSGTIVVTLQNGIGNAEVLARSLGGERVVQGSTTVAAQVQGPGRVSVAHATLEGRSLTSLGRPTSPGAAAASEQLARALVEASLPAVVLDDVRAVVWRKLAMAAGIGPLCAILGATVADVLARPPALDLLRATFAEIVSVAGAEDVALDSEELWSAAIETYRAIGPHPPSLAVDVARGRPSEIEAQLGEVVRRGQSAGIATPAADVLTKLIRSSAPLTR